MEYHPFNVEIPKIPPFDRHPEQRPNMVARSGLMIVWDKGNHPQKKRLHQWIGLRENLPETIDFPIKYGVFL